jgi:hypothetical protein
MYLTKFDYFAVNAEGRNGEGKLKELVSFHVDLILNAI